MPRQLRIANGVDIVNGPSKMDLMLALFDDGGVGHRRVIIFTIDGREREGERSIKVVVNAVEREDGSGESWNFKGYFSGSNVPFEGYYSTKRRKGFIKTLV